MRTSGGLEATKGAERLPLLIPARTLWLAKDSSLLHALARWTCPRCKWVFRGKVRYLLHVLQCPGASEEHRAGAVWALASNLSFVPALWPKGTPLAVRLATVGAREARRAGYTSIAAWLRGVIYRPAFQAAIAAIHTPTAHRRARKHLRDGAGDVAQVAPVDLPPEWFEWWLRKETQRRAEPVLLDLLGGSARAGRLPADDELRGPHSTAEGAREDDVERIAAMRRDLHRLCDPEAADSLLSARERRHLYYWLEGYSTPEIRDALGMRTIGAVATAAHRLRKKLPESVRAALRPAHRSRDGST